MSGKSIAPCLLVSMLAVGCAQPRPAKAPEPVAQQATPQLAFQIIKTNDVDGLSRIVMSPADFARLMEMELQRSQAEVDPAEIEKRSAESAKSCLRKAQRSMQKVRDLAKDSGFDWPSAQLTSVMTDGGPFDPSASDVHLDLLLLIESGEQQLRVKLDDCFFVNGHRRLADGFSLMRR